MTNIGSVMAQIPDILEAVDIEEVTVLPLAPNTKECRIKGWNNKHFSKDELLQCQENNFALVLKQSEKEYSYTCIDVDGTLSDKDVKGLTNKDKVASKHLLNKILFDALKDIGMLVETASDGGAHIYIRVKGEVPKDAHELSNQFNYPLDCGIEGLEGQPMKNAIEIFGGQKSRYVVLPGSQINDNIYKVSLESEFNRIFDLPLVEFDDVEQRIRTALIKNSFEPIESAQTEKLEKKYDVGFVKDSSVKVLPDYNIEKLADFVIPIFKHNDGAKWYCTHPLAGYLSRFVDKESTIRLGEVIVEKEPDLFKDDCHFIKTLVSSYDRDEEKKTGAKTLYEKYAKDVYSGKEFWFKLIYYTNSTVYFYPAGKRGSSYKKIALNSNEKQIEVEHWRVNKNGKHYISSIEPALGFQLIDMKRIENPVIKNAPAKFEFSYIPSGNNKICYITGESMRDIEQELKETVGVVLSGNFKTIFNQIIVHFSKINLIDTSVSSSVPGIFNIDGKIKRFDYNKEEVSPGFSHHGLVQAVNLLNDIKDVFPIHNDKLGHIIRVALLLPFHHLLKHSGHMGKYLVLDGAGGALKSTIAEMLVNFYNISDTSTENANIYGGGAFSSPYQVGKKFGISGYPFVVNEPGKAFQDDEIIEILKSAVESDVARITNDGTYYSYCTAVFATNVDVPQSDAFLRRCNIFHFEMSERATDADIEKVAALLNKSKINDRFAELSPIGDFCFTYLAKNSHLVNELSTEDLELHLVEQIEKEVDMDLSWLKENGIDDSVKAIDELDNEVLSEFLQYIKDAYNRTFFTYQKLEMDEDNKAVAVPISFNVNELVTLATRGLCPIINYRSKDNKILIASTKIKNFFKNECSRVITYSEFYNELLEFSGEYEIEKDQFMIEGKRFRGISLEPELIVDLLNNDLRTKEDDNNE